MPTYMAGLRVFRTTELWTGVLPIHTFPTRPGCPTLLPDNIDEPHHQGFTRSICCHLFEYVQDGVVHAALGQHIALDILQDLSESLYLLSIEQATSALQEFALRCFALRSFALRWLRCAAFRRG